MFHNVNLRKMEWISVKDRLPEIKDADENGKVLVYRLMNEWQKSLSKSILDYYHVKYCEDSSYWMPLPPNPTNSPE